jgi:F-type H+-transporting ATPase subunit epsilon
MAERIALTVVTRERRILEEEVDAVVLPAANGYLGVLPGHTPLLASLRVGELAYRDGSETRFMVLRWGFAEILPNRVIVLAEGAMMGDEIDLETAERWRREAEKELQSLASHDEKFRVAEAKLEESISMISIAGRRG